MLRALCILLVALAALAAPTGARHMTYNVPALNATAPAANQTFVVLSPPCNTTLTQYACNVLSDAPVMQAWAAQTWAAQPWEKTAAAVGEAVQCTFVYRGTNESDTRQWLLRATGVCV